MIQKETVIAPFTKIPRKKMMSILLFPALLIVFVVTAGAAVYFYLQVVELKKTPQVLAQQEVQTVVDKVSRLIVLPEGETPTIATVQDPEKLKDQPFFNKAQKGDKVLIYTNAKKAILYSPTTNKIVEVAPINIGNTPTTSDTTNK